MWNPLYGTRGGVPYGGACLPKDTIAFLQFVREQGMQHLVLEAAIDVNRRLAASVPAASSPDKIDEALDAKAKGEKRVILFNLSGHGNFDMGAYEAYLSGKLEDYEYPAEAVQEAMKHLPQVQLA